MMDRRNFLFATAGSLTALDLFSSIDLPFAKQLDKHLNKLENMSFDAAAENEDFWGWIRQSYTVSPNIINLNNGGVSPQPKIVQDAHIRFYQYSNEAPSYYMWRILDQGREALREKLATLCGVLPEELAINRNATEGLNNVIFGLNLKAGDEVVLSTFDYPNMMNAWKQREKRDKVKLNWITIPQPTDDVATIVKLYEKAITPKTKIVHITHMMNWTGNFVPVKAIADMAHSKGCEVIVDAAHSFGQIDMKFEETGADYLATSLHKWLCAPFGSGLMYIKKDKIKNVWALLSSVDPDGSDMKKFESIGTRSFASEMAIGTAVDFHNLIGGKRKEARLRYLKDYWATKCHKLPKANFYTSMKPEFSCAVATIGFEGWQAQQIEAKLFEKHKVHSVSMILEKVNGIRIAPNVYTNTEDLDVLIKGLTEISKMEAPTPQK
ncbi:MAG: aminotransferase class V-fold PLP-dependent enzyme [Bacteroidota bacterium]|nr:aminotransferase class V-fold PLP-dependent enzyme [Bacteroidota bacterium]